MDAAPVSLYALPTSPPNWDRVGVFYMSFCCIWTALVFSGMAFCLLNRHHPVLKIRGLLLSFSAIAFLHAYWVLAQITYPIGRTMPIVLAHDIQYFFMGIWFPLGIALFHASNLRFLHIAKLQKQFAYPGSRFQQAGCNGAKTSWLCRLRDMEYTRRIMLFIGIGMVFQILLTVGMWLACKKYHPTYGIPGTEIRGDSLQEQIVDLGRGWEWWPSVVWQVIWTWIVAPILIWRVWGIRDTMGWRTQTVGCCLANLHATPMFLIASYVPAFAKVNAYFTPSQWIHLSVMMFEIFTVFVPAFQVVRHRLLIKKATDTNAKWETSSQMTLRVSNSAECKKGLSNTYSLAEKGQSLQSMDDCLPDRLLTMPALEHVLSENPGPLQHFSAFCDFSGENVAFLTRLSEWSATYPPSPDGAQMLDAYNGALHLYIDFISPRDAEFPLNLSSADLKSIQRVFEKPARIICGDCRVDPATPFNFEPEAANSSLWSMVRYTGPIPPGFGPDVFDKIQSHVKYLVFTNTWPKFVEHLQRRRRSSESERSNLTSASSKTLVSRVSSTVSGLLRPFR